MSSQVDTTRKCSGVTRFSCADSRRQVIRLFSRSAERTPMGSGTPKAGSQTPLAQGSCRVPEMPGTNRKTASFNTPTDPEKMGLAPVVRAAEPGACPTFRQVTKSKAPRNNVAKIGRPGTHDSAPRSTPANFAVHVFCLDSPNLQTSPEIRVTPTPGHRSRRISSLELIGNFRRYLARHPSSLSHEQRPAHRPRSKIGSDGTRFRFAKRSERIEPQAIGSNRKAARTIRFAPLHAPNEGNFRP